MRSAVEVRPAYVCHMRAVNKLSLKRLWYVSSMIRGLTVEEAVKQLSFVHMAEAIIAKYVR